MPRPSTPIMSNDNLRSIPLFHGNYREKEEPSLWFTQFQLSLPDSYLDAHMADQWFNSMILICGLFTQLQKEFMIWWPAPKPPQYSRVQQKECIIVQVLKEEDIGIWLPGEPIGNYRYVTWANKVMRITIGMGDSIGLLVEYVLEGIPNILKDHMTCSYSLWQEFLQDIESVPAIKLKRAKEDLNMNRMCDANIVQLKAQSSPSLNTLPLQFSQLSMDSRHIAQPYYQTSRTYANISPFLSLPSNVNVGAMTAQETLLALVNRPLQNTGASPMGWQGNPLTHVTFTRMQIMEKLNMVPQHQNTENGICQYEADVNTWHRMHGMEGIPSLERPYPLHPVTKPMHLSSQCTATEVLRPQESRWWQHVAAMLRRAALGQTSIPMYSIAQTTQTTHLYYQQYGAPLIPQVFTVQEEQGWWDQTNAWTQQEAGYEWEPENYGGPLHIVEQ
ncbi:hypothetical protein BDR06DRAFT_967643 [Suillus hirtellus]|nr:hypothetical protein BDR06DRAFT_967643 [Suillus hirtellus]